MEGSGIKCSVILPFFLAILLLLLKHKRFFTPVYALRIKYRESNSSSRQRWKDEEEKNTNEGREKRGIRKDEEKML